MSETPAPSLRPFVAPRYWPLWLFVGFLRLLAWPPSRAQVAIGAALGRVLGLLLRRNRATARRNIEICFPELGADARARLLDRHLRSIGLSFVETANAWFAPRDKVTRLVELRGLEHLDAVRRSGRGALLYCAHFTTLEICGAVLGQLDHPVATMYRPQHNAMVDMLVRRGRGRFIGLQIARDDVRGLLRRLKEGWPVIYLPDQTYLGNQSALIPFFGEPAVTNIATSKLARISGAAVLPLAFLRRADDSGYVAEVYPPLDDFPSDDAIADTRRLVAILEGWIRRAPEQYLWTYKKFKHRPPPLPDLYRTRDKPR